MRPPFINSLVGCPLRLRPFGSPAGLGANSFTYATLGLGVAVIASLLGILLCDRIGRRPILIGGAAAAALFNFIVAGVGSQPVQTDASTNAVVASMILLLSSCKFSFQNMGYLISAEIGGTKMRKKCQSYETHSTKLTLSHDVGNGR